MIFKNISLDIGKAADFFSALFMAGAMAVFHIYEYLEKKMINNEMFYKVWSTLPVRMITQVMTLEKVMTLY